MKLVLQQTEVMAVAASFTRLYKHCQAKKLARKEQLRLLMHDKSVMLELSAGAIREALEMLNGVLTTAPDSNGNYVINTHRKHIGAIKDLIQGRIRLLRTQVIPAYETRYAQIKVDDSAGRERIMKYLSTSREKAAFLEKMEVKCLRALT